MANSGPIDSSQKIPLFEDADYAPILANWYEAKPYGFKFTPKEGVASIMFLPINPSNLTVTTHFATSITPTIYGTVEEHSPVRYFDISIEGTTGMAPKYVAPAAESAKPKAGGRTNFAIKNSLVNKATQGFASKTLTTFENFHSEATSLLGTDANTGLQLDQTGYLAWHNLFRFLLKYKKDASGSDKNGSTARKANSHPLQFFNYKDNNKYNVVIRSMTLRRDKEDPMMYHYNIQMRGYALGSVDRDNAPTSKEQGEILKNLGLDGVDGSLFLTDAKRYSSRAKSVLGSVANGFNQFGR